MAIAAVAGLASVGGAMAAAGTFAIGFAAAATAFAIGAGLSIISRALMPKPDFGSMVNDSLTTTVREPASTRKVVYGKVRVGGSVVFITNSNANKNLYLVIAFAGHGIEDYESIWFNDQKVWENGSFLSNWGSYANFGIHKGFQSASDSVLTAASNDWTSTHVLNGIAYLRVRLVWDEDRKMFPNGVPNISAIIKGRKVYDPRLDSTNGGSGSTERMRITSGGEVRVKSGDIVFDTAGKGIVLGNTSNADANTLDDYEEGVWTPVPYYQNASDQSVAENNDSNALGRYVVVGRQVTLWAAVRVDMSSTSITFDNFGIKGLPFSTANITNYRAVGCFAYSNSNVADEDTAFTISMGANNNHMHIQQQDGTGNMAQNFGNSSNMELFGTISFLLP